MKVEINNIQNVEMIGDIKENKVTIDTKNVEFITHILSSNLYSNPMRSFLREIISNAYDSHKEANNPDPIILDIGYDNDQIYIRIQDFGTGLGKERFASIYRFIGSSTKRESNDYIGSFGIGRFSALSVSDSCFITDRYNGVETKYLMYKENMTIKIDELSSTNTKEHNGLEVLVYLPNNSSVSNNIVSSLEHISYFDKLFITVNYPHELEYSKRYPLLCIADKAGQFNKRRIKKYNNFSVCPMLADKPVLCVGSVIYPIDNLSINIPDELKNACLQIHIPIGSVNVTPNREQILYTDLTKDYIQKAVDNTYQEILSMASAQVKDVNSIEGVADLISGNIEVNLYNYDNYTKSVKFKFSKLIQTDIKIFGNVVKSEELSLLFDYLSNIYYILVSYKANYAKRTKNINMSQRICDIILRRYFDDGYEYLFLKDDERLQASVNNWVKSRKSYRIYKADTDRTQNSINTVSLTHKDDPSILHKDRILGIAQRIAKEFEKKLTLLNNNVIDDNTKELYKPARKAKEVSEDSYPRIYNDRRLTVSYNSLKDCFNNTSVLYIWTDNDNLLYFEYIEKLIPCFKKVYTNYRDIVLLKIAKRDLELCEENSGDNFINVIDLFSSDAAWVAPLKKAIAIYNVNDSKIVSWAGTLRTTCYDFKKLHDKLEMLNQQSLFVANYRALSKEAAEIIDNILNDVEDYEPTDDEKLTQKDEDFLKFLIFIFNDNINRGDMFVQYLGLLYGYEGGLYQNKITEMDIYKNYEECYKNFKVHLSNS